MQEDNVLGKSSESFFLDEPIDQVKERNEEQAEAFKEAPLIKAAIDNIEKSITFHSSIDSLEDLLSKPQDHLIAVLAAKKTVAVLKAEKSKLEDLLRTHEIE